jgi:hypothetical protein
MTSRVGVRGRIFPQSVLTDRARLVTAGPIDLVW